MAINYTAGLYQLFARTVDPLPPVIEMRQNDAQGAIIPPNGSGGGTIFVRAEDPTDASHPHASGIYKMELRPVLSGAAIAPAPAIAAIGKNPATRTFSNLAEDEYILTVFDGLGNNAQVVSTVADSAPSLRVDDAA